MAEQVRLGLDVGDKRVGLALAVGLVIKPLPAVLRADGAAEAEVLKLIQEHGITVLVVGLPLDSNGRETNQSLKVKNFCRRVERRSHAITISYVDEYLSSEEIKQRFKIDQKREREYRKSGHLDSLCACLFLEEYAKLE